LKRRPCCQLEWLTALPWAPPPAGSDAVTRTDFLSNAKSQLDADHFGLDKVKRRLIEYLAIVRLRALIAQEAEVEQAKAQEVTLKKAIEAPAAGDEQKENDQARRGGALVKAGEIPMLIPSPTPTEVRGPRKAAKPIKAPILLCVSLIQRLWYDNLTDMKRTGSSDHRERERRH